MFCKIGNGWQGFGSSGGESWGVVVVRIWLLGVRYLPKGFRF